MSATDTPVTKMPRLYTDQDLGQQDVVSLSDGQAHYLKNVLRLQTGAQIRLFNGRDGEWVYTLTTLKKNGGIAHAAQKIREQQNAAHAKHLFFPPIKKQRLDFLIEKAVELDVTDLHPILTARTEVRKINTARITAQIIEAAEQCERLDIPALHPLKTLDEFLHTASIVLHNANSGGTTLSHGDLGGRDNMKYSRKLAGSVKTSQDGQDQNHDQTERPSRIRNTSESTAKTRHNSLSGHTPDLAHREESCYAKLKDREDCGAENNTTGTSQKIYACLERRDAPPLKDIMQEGPAAYLIGPEGGFTEEEIQTLLQNSSITPVSLGPHILRTETAALKCLSLH